MDSHIARYLACGAFALSAVAAATAQTRAAAAPAVAASPGASVPAAASALSRGDRNWMQHAAEMGHAEVQAARLAMEKAVNTQVKGFAQRMVDEHGKSNDELAALAQSKGVSLPAEPSIAMTSKLKLLSTRSGAAFDRAYAEGFGVNAHRDAVRLFQKAAEDAQDADVKAFAAKTLPVVQQHFATAKELKEVVDKEGNVKAPTDRKQ